MAKDTSQTGKSRRKPRSQGDIKQVKQSLFLAIRELERVVSESGDAGELIKASHALATCSGAWLRVYERGELDDTLEANRVRRFGI